MITLKTAQQIEKMRIAGALLSEILSSLQSEIRPGITTRQLDRHAEQMIRDAGAIPSFKGYNGFPWSICASPDAVVVHGFPDDKPLTQGQILSVDCGLVLNGWQADSAFTVGIGEISPEAEKLISVTEECFWLAVKQCKVGKRLGDIAHAVQSHAEAHGYGVIRDLCGHGIGTKMHEDPSVPNFGDPGRGVRLREGMTIAIEPMIAMGDYPVFVKDDGWTVLTRDASLCAHYEHTVAITAGEPEVLTKRRAMREGVKP